MARYSGFIAAVLLTTLLVACNLPGDVGPIATEVGDVSVEPTESTVEQATEPVDMSTETIPNTPTIKVLTESLLSTQRMQPGADIIIQEIYMIDPSRGWAIGGVSGDSNSVLRTEDGGLQWVEVSPPLKLPEQEPVMAAGSFLDHEIAWILYYPLAQAQPGRVQEATIWHTEDAGAHWRPSLPVKIEFIGSEYAHAWIQFVNPDQGWVLARYGGAGMHRYPVYLLSSDDGGVNWSVLEDPYEGLWLQGCPKTGWSWMPSGVGMVTIGFCPIDSAEIHISTNMGLSWETIRLPFPPGEESRYGSTSCRAHSPLIFTDGELIVASECPIWGDEPETDHLLYRSSDQGTTWQIESYPGGQLVALTDGTLFALSREHYRSNDGGENWEFIKQVAWDGQFSFTDLMHAWAVARDEDEIAFVRTEDGGETWQLIDPVLIP